MKKNIKSLFLKILSLPFEHPWISFFIIVFLFNILGTTDPPEPKLYPATLYIEDNKAIPCIVQIEKIVDRYEERNGRTHSDLWYTIREMESPNIPKADMIQIAQITKLTRVDGPFTVR